ncbi:MAG: hypothetical protein JW742_05325 [Candidatus Aminicenantes bacterium]|nr:hypothetical protein [Candidatus Aminicenantes bacterium]
MDVKEHVYADDPGCGHPDVRTDSAGTEYGFLGNGLIQAAVQISSDRAATPLGLLLMDPEVLGPKRSALSLDKARGLTATAVTIVAGRTRVGPTHGRIRARWTEAGGLPAFEASWSAGDWRVTEAFQCPDRKTPRLIRTIRVRNASSAGRRLRVETGLLSKTLGRTLRVGAGEERVLLVAYALAGRSPRREARCAWTDSAVPAPSALRYWNGAARIAFHHARLDRLLAAARHQLPSVVARSGKVDGGIWQYNLEWVRDQALMAEALVSLGFASTGRTMLGRILGRSVSADGATFDSGRLRPPEESEFDQNGVLLSALDAYASWTGDLAFLRSWWPRIRALAEYPLQPAFRDPASGLLHNRREYWERHAAHGIRDGMELAHQLYVARGLGSAAGIARLLGKSKEAERWLREGWRLRRAAFGGGRCSLIDSGRLIKRRLTTGAVQREIRPGPDSGLAAGVPLFAPGRHRLDPDTSTALPIALGFLPARGRIAARTLADLETLWNQRWTGGGYGRYHVSSEPDAPGPWPFASLFVARALFEAGDDRRVWRVLNWLERVRGGRAGAWFEFYGPRPVPPCPQVGIVPWTWAEIVFLVVRHILGVRPGLDGLLLRPRLPEGLDGAEAELPMRGRVLKLHLERTGRGSRPACWADGRRIPWPASGVFWPHAARVSEVRIALK